MGAPDCFTAATASSTDIILSMTGLYLPDAAATDASQVAHLQGLQHGYQWEPFPAPQPVFNIYMPNRNEISNGLLARFILALPPLLPL